MFDYDDDEAEQYPQAYGIPRWWPRFPIDPVFLCTNGCGATTTKVNSMCLDCEYKKSLPVMEAELDELIADCPAR